MSDFSQYREKVANFGKLANQAEKDKNYEEAYNYYTKALDIFMHMVKYEKNPKLIEIYKQKMYEYMERAEYLKKTVLNKQEESFTQGGGSAAAAKKKDDKSEDKEEEKLQEALSSAIVKEKPNIKWSDVAGLDQAKASLQEAVILPTKFP
mmetsp:Transcript_23429/g.17887  ORF Transcript_23429/g.17887 Transcript_23429/m.17887 type:complete len:150 (+) Transcript_23429:31-480(+)